MCWIEGYERIAEMAPDRPDKRLMYREADLMPLMLMPMMARARAQDLGTRVNWLVQAKHNRSLPTSCVCAGVDSRCDKRYCLRRSESDIEFLNESV